MIGKMWFEQTPNEKMYTCHCFANSIKGQQLRSFLYSLCKDIEGLNMMYFAVSCLMAIAFQAIGLMAEGKDIHLNFFQAL